MSRLQQITFYTKAGGQQSITVQDYDALIALEFFGRQADEAVSGRLRQRLKGSRQQFRVSYRGCVEPAEYRTLLNNILSDLEDGEDSITVSEGSDLSNAVVVVPEGEFQYRAKYAHQIGETLPMVSFIAVTINSNTDSRYVDAGYVDPGYVE